MDSLLDTYVRSINLLQPAATLYLAKYDCLVRFCNELTKEVPWKLEDALEDSDEKTTPHSILRFIYLCDRMMKRFKVELKEMKEQKACHLTTTLLFSFFMFQNYFTTTLFNCNIKFMSKMLDLFEFSVPTFSAIL